jgi:hypothetical protein
LSFRRSEREASAALPPNGSSPRCTSIPQCDT